MHPPDLLTLATNAGIALPWLWTFFLLLTRYIALLTILPGTGLGSVGIIVRVPAATLFAVASLYSGSPVEVPEHWITMGIQIVAEVSFGTLLGLIPMTIVAGVQVGAQIASTTMGLSASNLIDPTSGAQVPDLTRIYGDLMVVVFIVVGGYLSIIHAASGLGSSIVPGAPFAFDAGAEIIMRKTADIFQIGVMISAPVVVALLITQFVMGLISRAVPTVNIFIMSFPLTIGIGLILSAMVLPGVTSIFKTEVAKLDVLLATVVELRDQSKVLPSRVFKR